jgi:hypothetical protein
MFENPFAGLSIVAGVISVVTAPISDDFGTYAAVAGLVLGAVGWLASKAGWKEGDHHAIIGMVLSAVGLVVVGTV